MCVNASLVFTHIFSSLSRGRRTWTLDIWFWRPTFCQLNYTPLSLLFIYLQNSTQNKPPWSSPRPISGSQLRALLRFHPCPIHLMFPEGSYRLPAGTSHLGEGFTLRCLQRLSRPGLATLPCIWYATGAPAARPARSSRTGARPPQTSSARAG